MAPKKDTNVGKPKRKIITMVKFWTDAFPKKKSNDGSQCESQPSTSGFRKRHENTSEG